MKRVTLATLLLAFLSPVAALAYSYDEIVMMVKAEEKVFGKANYDQSLDQRLEVLENSVVGYKLTGSDSFRLRAICKKLGLEKAEGAIMAAPVSVEYTPAPKGGMPSVAPDFTADSAEPMPAPSFRSPEHFTPSSEPLSKSHRLASLTHASESVAEAKEVKPANIAVVREKPAKSARAALVPSIVHASTKFVASKPVMHSPNADTTATSPVQAVSPVSESQPVGTDNGGLIAVAVGIASIIGGIGLFCFIRGKEDTVSITRCRAYARTVVSAEQETVEWTPAYAGVPVAREVLEVADEEFFYSERSEKVERMPAPVFAAPEIVQVEEVSEEIARQEIANKIEKLEEAVRGSSAVTMEIGPIAQMPAATIEPAHEDDFVSGEDFDMDDYVHLVPEEHKVEEQAPEVESMNEEQIETLTDFTSPIYESAEVLTEESLSFINSMNREQLGMLLEEFVPSVIALESMNEFHLLNASAMEDESKLLIQEREPITFDCSGEITDTSVPSVWPEYHPEVAPRIYTVSTFVKEALKDASELIGCTAVEKEREEHMQFESEEEGYRALAQLLIEAASKPCNPLPPVVHVPAALPLGARSMPVASSAGRTAPTDYESSLRSLFSEKF